MEELFASNLPLLKKLFGADVIEQQQDLIKSLLEETENCWDKNIDRLRGHKVERILIGEAPCSGDAVSEYFYKTIFNSYHLKIWKGLYPDTPLPDQPKAYEMLADKGFLLVDSIPFSMKYAGKRDKKDYSILLKNGVNWMVQKLSDKRINYADEVKVAFSYKANGLKVMEALDGKLPLKKGQSVVLSPSQIAADGSGYTNSRLLGEILAV
ncbi:MAG TPA: hypothetical protein VEC12_04750 [Bacteroidia bacterium]|nr:hypothetical protein [Bacteroidia bacterium]